MDACDERAGQGENRFSILPCRSSDTDVNVSCKSLLNKSLFKYKTEFLLK